MCFLSLRKVLTVELHTESHWKLNSLKPFALLRLQNTCVSILPLRLTTPLLTGYRRILTGATLSGEPWQIFRKPEI